MRSLTLSGLKLALALTDDEISDLSLPGMLHRIERLEQLSHDVCELLTAERRSCIVTHAIGGETNAS
jgi:hypothetical protein